MRGRGEQEMLPDQGAASGEGVANQIETGKYYWLVQKTAHCNSTQRHCGHTATAVISISLDSIPAPLACLWSRIFQPE
jgi:hypothetical protein